MTTKRPEDEAPPPVPAEDEDAIKGLEDPEPAGPPADEPAAPRE